jgi:glycosyltransferase involved in cell wall biosynthesis
VGGIPEIIDNNKNGIIIFTKKSEEIRNSIEYFIKNPLYMKDFGIELNKKIIETFSEKEMLEKTFWLYKKML